MQVEHSTEGAITWCSKIQFVVADGETSFFRFKAVGGSFQLWSNDRSDLKSRPRYSLMSAEWGLPFSCDLCYAGVDLENLYLWLLRESIITKLMITFKWLRYRENWIIQKHLGHPHYC